MPAAGCPVLAAGLQMGLGPGSPARDADVFKGSCGFPPPPSPAPLPTTRPRPAPPQLRSSLAIGFGEPTTSSKARQESVFKVNDCGSNHIIR